MSTLSPTPPTSDSFVSSQLPTVWLIAFQRMAAECWSGEKQSIQIELNVGFRLMRDHIVGKLTLVPSVLHWLECCEIANTVSAIVRSANGSELRIRGCVLSFNAPYCFVLGLPKQTFIVDSTTVGTRSTNKSSPPPFW